MDGWIDDIVSVWVRIWMCIFTASLHSGFLKSNEKISTSSTYTTSLSVCVCAVFLGTRMGRSVMSFRCVWRTTASAVRTVWSVSPSYSCVMLCRGPAAPAGVHWAHGYTSMTRASPSCASSPNAQVTRWPKSLWNWNLRPDRPRMGGEDVPSQPKTIWDS